MGTTDTTRSSLRLDNSGVQFDTPLCRVHALRPGLTLTVTRADERQGLAADFDIDDAPLQMGFTCRGRSRCTCARGSGGGRTFDMRPGSNSFYFLPKTRGSIEWPRNTPTCIVGISASREMLLTYLAQDMDRLPRDFRAALEGAGPKGFAWFGGQSPAKTGLLRQILQCPYAGSLGTLFLESRVLELMTLQLDEFLAVQGEPSAPTRLKREDVPRIQAARDHLLANAENPPCLRDLARFAGVNEKKLKHGFRHLYGAPVFAYLREHRLQQAFELLSRGDMNVSEVAYEVGYVNLSHFSKAFQQRFGVKPLEFLDRHRRVPANT